MMKMVHQKMTQSLLITIVIIYKIHKSRIEQFYGTEAEIWAEFGPVGITEKKNMGQL
jgi:hypothetical protein